MTNYTYYKVTELKDLPKPIQEYIIKCVDLGFKKNIIKNHNMFMKKDWCIYTSQILSLCSNYCIKVVEGYTVDSRGRKYIHSWNEYNGYHFNLIKDNHIYLSHYGKIINKEVLRNHLITHTDKEKTLFRLINK